MTRLIDANALIAKLRSEIKESDESPYYDGKTFLQAGIYESIAIVENEPTIS